jgi:hypothetical protein
MSILNYTFFKNILDHVSKLYSIGHFLEQTMSCFVHVQNVGIQLNTVEYNNI